MTTSTWTCARQELSLSVRSQWTQIFSVVFAVLALAVAASGYVLSGGYGFQDFARTAASLLQLVLLLVPLAALLFGVITFTPDRGSAELLYSQPVSRYAVVGGQLLGAFLALVGAQAIGFGAAGLVIFTQSGAEGVSGFLGVMAGSAALTAIFLGLAAAISAGDTTDRRARNLAIALVIWFGAVVLFDVAVLGVASLLPSGLASRVLIVSTLVNPIDAARTSTLLAVEGKTAFGSGSLAFLRFTGGPAGAAAWLGASIVAWTALPLIAAGIRVRRSDI